MSPTTPSWDQLLRPILNALRSRQGRPGLTGLHGSTTGFSLTLLARELADTSWLIVTATDEAAERLYDDLASWWPLFSPPEEYDEEAFADLRGSP